MQCNHAMKSAVIPEVRVDAQLRSDLQSVLNEGETLWEFVAISLKYAVEYRLVQTRFHARGQQAWEEFERSGKALSADVVLARMNEKIDAKRKRMGE